MMCGIRLGYDEHFSESEPNHLCCGYQVFAAAHGGGSHRESHGSVLNIFSGGGSIRQCAQQMGMARSKPIRIHLTIEPQMIDDLHRKPTSLGVQDGPKLLAMSLVDLKIKIQTKTCIKKKINRQKVPEIYLDRVFFW